MLIIFGNRQKISFEYETAISVWLASRLDWRLADVSEMGRFADTEEKT